MRKIILIIFLAGLPISTSLIHYSDGEGAIACGYECDEDFRSIADGTMPSEEPDYSGDLSYFLNDSGAYSEDAPIIVASPLVGLDNHYWEEEAGALISSHEGTMAAIQQAGGLKHIIVKEKCDSCDSGLAQFNLDDGGRSLASEPSCETTDEDVSCK